VCAGGAAAIIVTTEVKKLYLRKKQGYITGENIFFQFFGGM
jgi:hypothetical protein